MTDIAAAGNGQGCLYVCATPIGNLEDVTCRLLRVLREVDLIAAEDTRQTKRLCNRYGITTPLISCHQRNERQRAGEILRRLGQGQSIAYVSDAGTPGISDPGSRLVAAVYEAGYPVIPIPGPSAVTAALSVSGFPADSFVFLGFLPRKGKERRQMLERIAREPLPVVLFEAPHRIEQTLRDLISTTGSERPAWVGRELTKSYETAYRGALADVTSALLADPVRGEYTIVLGPWPEATRVLKTNEGQQHGDSPLADQVNQLINAGWSPNKAIRQVAAKYGLTRREVYRQVKIDQQ